MPSMIRTRKSDLSARSDVVRKILLTSASGVLLLAVFLLACAAICLHYNWSGILLKVCVYASCALASLQTGFIAGKAFKKSGMLYGSLCALLTGILPLMLSLILYRKVGSGFVLAAALIVLFGALGGVLSVNMRHKRKYR